MGLIQSRKMATATLTTLSLLSLAAGQQYNVHHVPIIHQNGGASYQSATFFGQRQPHYYHAIAQPDTVHQAGPVRSYSPVPAPAPVQSVKTYQPVQPQVYTPVQPQVYKPVQPQVYKPIQPVKTVQPIQPVQRYPSVQPQAYQPAQLARTANYQQTYKYDPLQNNFSLKDFIYVDAEAYVDDAIAQMNKFGPKVVSSLRTILKNKLIGKFLSTSDSVEDPCSVISADLDVTVDEMIKAITSSRQELVDIIKAVQEVRRAEKEPSAAIIAASKAVSSLDPLIPKFAEAFKANAECDNKVKAAIANFDQIGSILTTLGSTNIATSDQSAKNKIIQTGQASKIIGKVTQSLEEGGFTSLCPDSPNFSGQVFSGVGELLGGLQGILGTFGGSQNDISSLDDTVDLIKEGAELLKELNIDESVPEVPVSADCSASLPDVSKALEEVAELVDVIDTSSFQ